MDGEKLISPEALDHPFIGAYVTASEHIRESLDVKLETAMMELINEAIGVAAQKHSIPIQITSEIMDSIRKADRNRMKTAWGVGPGGSEPEYDLSKLRHYYEEFTWPTIKGAKAVYKKNQTSKRWREHVKTEYPDLDDDLIARLPKDPQLPDDVAELIANKGGTSAPSDIALELAARMCDARPYRYSIAYLKEVKAAQKNRFQSEQMNPTDNQTSK
jgi:hypothetical protein